MRRNLAGLTLIAALAVILTLGIVPTVTHLYAQQHGFAGAVDPRLIDLGSLAANAALLVALFRIGGRRRVTDHGPEEAE